MMKITTPTKLTEEDKELLKKSRERSEKEIEKFIEEHKRKNVITEEVEEPAEPSSVIDIRKKLLGTRGMFLLELVEEGGFLAPIPNPDRGVETEWILDNHRGFFTVHDIDYPREIRDEDGKWIGFQSGPTDETYFYRDLDEDATSGSFEKDNKEQAIDFLKGLRTNKDFLVEKENLDWLVKQEKHFGIK
tara:strand:+ start:293 stop:859 length:567 start_codon:yes stop_codon:yes gene_type:complete